MIASPLTVGSLALGVPVLVGGVTAANLTVSSPGLNAGLLAPNPLPPAAALAVASPLFGAPALTQVQALPGAALTVGRPAFGAPVALQLIEYSLFSPPVLAIGSPAAGFISPPFAGNVVATAGLTVGSPVFGAPALVGEVTGAALTVGSPAIGTPIVSSVGPVSFVDSSPVLGAAPLVQFQVLAAANLAVGSPVIPALSLLFNLIGRAAPLTVGSPVLNPAQLIQQGLLAPVGLTVGSPLIGATTSSNIITAAPITIGSPLLSPTPPLGHGNTAAPLIHSPAIVDTFPAFSSFRVVLTVFTYAFDIGTFDAGTFDTNELIESSPVLGAPVFIQYGAMVGSLLSVGSPVIGSPALPLHSVLPAATAFTDSPPVFSASALGIVFNPGALTVASPTLGAGILGQIDAMKAGAFAVGSPSFTYPATNFSLGPAALAVGSPLFTTAIINPPPLAAASFGVAQLHVEAPLLAAAGLQPDVGSQLLYRAASGLERAMADADAVRLMGIVGGLVPELIIDIWDPFACPLDLLPYLAWAMGVTFWNDQWSETTKRSWIAVQWQFKALRGTEAGLDMVVDYAGRDVSPYGYAVKKVITRPQQLFPGGSVSAADREAWLASLPQVRVFYYLQTGTAPALKFFIRSSWLGTTTGPSYDGTAFPIPSDAFKRLGRQAVWNVHGADTGVPVQDFGSYFQLRFFGNAGIGSFVSMPLLPSGALDGTYRFFVPSTAWKRLVTIEPDTTQTNHQIAVGPSLQAVQSSPEHVALPGLRGVGMFVGSNYIHGGGVFMSPGGIPAAVEKAPPIYPSFLLPSTSKYRLFQRYAVFDPDDLPPHNTPATMFMGVGRFGYPAFTAEADIFMPSRDCPAKFHTLDKIAPRGRFMVPHDGKPLIYVASAVESSRRLVDKILLRTGPRPVFTAGAPFIADNDHFIVGQAQVSA